MRVRFADPSLDRFAVVQFLLEVQLWFPVWLLFLTGRGFALPTIVAADGVFRLTIVALELPLGRVADRIGRRRSLLVVGALTVAAYLAIASVTTTAGLLAAWVLWGALWAMTSGTATAYLYELTRQLGRSDDQVSIFGRVRAVTSAAVLVSHLAAGVLFALSPVAPFVVTAALGACALALTLGLPDVERRGPRPDRLPARRVAALAFGPRALRSAIVLAAVVLVFGWSVRILYQPLLLDRGVPDSLAGVSYFGYSAMAVLAGLLVGRLGRRTVVPTIVVGLGTLWVGVLGAGLLPALGPWVFVPVMGFGFALAWVLVEVVVSDRSADAVRATTLSVVGVVAGVVIAGARPALGLLADARSPALAFLVWAAVGVALAPLVALCVRGLGPPVPAGGAAPGTAEAPAPPNRPVHERPASP